jgi:Ger(x)C family germination protein
MLALYERFCSYEHVGPGRRAADATVACSAAVWLKPFFSRFAYILCIWEVCQPGCFLVCRDRCPRHLGGCPITKEDNGMSSFFKLCFFLLAISTLLTGCWDRVEVEQRRYVLGVGVDYIPPGQEARPGEKEYMEQTREERPDHRVTYAMAKLGGKLQGTEGRAPKKNEMEFLTSESAGTFQTARIALVRQDKKLFFEHIKTIVLSEEIARTDVREVLDFFIRDPEMRRRMRVVVCRGKAEEFLKLIPIGDTELPIVIANMMRARGASRMNPEADLGNIMERIHRGQAFDVPYMINAEGEPHIFGSAIFKNAKMIGRLSEVETIGLNWMRGSIRGGLVTTRMESDSRGTVVLEIFKTKTKRKVEFDEQGNVIFIVNVKVTGTVGENQIPDADTSTPEYLKKLSDAVSKQVEGEIVDTHRKLTELNADAAAIGRLIYQEHPEIWQQIGSQWDEIFPTVKLQVKVETEVSRVGLVRK